MAEKEEGQKDFAGKGGFTWWVGIIESRQDPLKMGRLKVRCVGWHADNRMEVPVDGLPWAMSMLPTNNTSPYPPNEGDMVFGFFTDGEAAQEPVVVGVFPGLALKEANPQQAFGDPREGDSLANAPRTIESKVYNTDGTGVELTEGQPTSYPRHLDEPSTSRLARNETIDKTFIQERKDNKVTGVETVNGTWDEPETKYNSVYPYNNVMETESGHIVEYDDTPGAERIHIAHRNGSFTEWYPDGDRVEKITKDKYSIVMKDDNVYIMGKCNITVQGDAEVYVKGNADLKVDGNIEGQIGGNVTADVGGSVSATVGGSVTADVGGSVTATASSFTLNGPTTINGTLTVSEQITGQSGGTFSGDVNGAGISLNSHTHTDTPGLGAGTTSPPN
jgi:phage gp45-like